MVAQKGLIRTKYVTKEAKDRTSGVLVLTNQRLLWLEKRGMLSTAYRASFEIDLRELQGITCGGAISKWVSITDKDGESVFHLHGVGPKEIEPFKDMILRQVQNLAEPTATTPVMQREVITKEIVMLPCDYCRSLMPQTSTFCPECGAKRKA